MRFEGWPVFRAHSNEIQPRDRLKQVALIHPCQDSEIKPRDWEHVHTHNLILVWCRARQYRLSQARPSCIPDLNLDHERERMPFGKSTLEHTYTYTAQNRLNASLTVLHTDCAHTDDTLQLIVLALIGCFVACLQSWWDSSPDDVIEHLSDCEDLSDPQNDCHSWLYNTIVTFLTNKVANKHEWLTFQYRLAE